jgi:GT2 family glycosyltransferase
VPASADSDASAPDSSGSRRVLLAIPVFNGRDFVPACVRSAAGLRSGLHRVDVVVLDDCSPEPGFSAELLALCQSLGVGYYRSPRNLGIPRNMNLALLRAMSGGYDYALIANSDTVLPINLVTGMVRVAEANADVGSVTAWSNNVSMFSIGSDEPILAEQDMVDWLSGYLEDEFGDLAVDLPSAVGFCMLVPVPVARRVGLFDPIFGRGYCEEVDWSRRTMKLGYRAVLAPSVFAYHQGGASTRPAGVLGAGLTTLSAHEAIVDLRHGGYHHDVAQFAIADSLAPVRARASRAIVQAAVRRWGYRIEVTKLSGVIVEACVPFLLDPDADDARLLGVFAGFALEVPLGRGDITADVQAHLGRPPKKVIILDRGVNADRMAGAAWDAGVEIEDRCVYPQRV